MTAMDFNSLFVLDPNIKGTLGHSAKLLKVRCDKDVRRHFFSLRVMDRWNALGGDVVVATSVNAFKMKLSNLRASVRGFFLDDVR